MEIVEQPREIFCSYILKIGAFRIGGCFDMRDAEVLKNLYNAEAERQDDLQGNDNTGQTGS